MRIFSGHSKPIETLVRTADGKAMLTLTRDDEHIVWTQPRGDNVNLVRQSSLAPGEHVHRAVVLDGGASLRKNYIYIYIYISGSDGVI